ncbi:MAG TPA: cytochrome c peroxidase [Polyangiaceae bacterium]|jgi:cytochrome c peroxidase|nr:cytochrome c peroxidase [Polyangiaceae bacterium]
MRASSLLALGLGIVGLSALLPACEDSNKRKDPPPPPPHSAYLEAPASSGVTVDPAQVAAFAGLPARFESPKNALTDEKIALGKMLYFEARLSKNQQISCNSCHDLAKYGVDGEKTSPGHKGQRGNRNSPTTLNAAAHVAQFWDGRAPDVEAQATKPITNPGEMALANDQAIVTVLESMPEYADAFKKAFPGDTPALTVVNVGKAIGAFERTLATSSRFDAFTKGDAKALSDAEKAGFQKFLSVGCNTCHSTATFGGTEYKKLGQAKPYPPLAEGKDIGREAVTKQATDRHSFKVASLRNVEKTGPYLHDGSVATLEQAVKLMGSYQLGKDLSDADVASIVTFLKTLTAEPLKIDPPKLPASTAKTPKPAAG